MLMQHTDKEKMKVMSLLEKVGVFDKEYSEWAFCGRTPFWFKRISNPFHDRNEDEPRGSSKAIAPSCTNIFRGNRDPFLKKNGTCFLRMAGR